MRYVPSPADEATRLNILTSKVQVGRYPQGEVLEEKYLVPLHAYGGAPISPIPNSLSSIGQLGIDVVASCSVAYAVVAATLGVPE